MSTRRANRTHQASPSRARARISCGGFSRGTSAFLRVLIILVVIWAIF